MRYLTEYSAIEWLKLLPIQHALKQVRNDVWLAVYKNNRTSKLSQFLAENNHLTNKNIALVIAIEQPWALAIEHTLSGDKDRRPVRRELLILSEQEHRIHEALRDQQAVERIAMMLRKIGDARRVAGGHRQFLKSAFA